MKLYERIRNAAKIMKQDGGVELYRQLVDLSAQALELQQDIDRLTEENIKLVEGKCIERHSELYVTLKSDADKILYCSHCWDHARRLIQVKCYNSGTFKCTHCSNNGIYDQEKWNS